MSSISSPPFRTDATLRLDEIRQVLAQTVAATEERERALTCPPTDDAAPDRERVLQGLFEQVETRLRAFHECTERAGRDAGEAYTVLAERQDALKGWLTKLNDSRQRLANWAGRAI